MEIFVFSFFFAAASSFTTHAMQVEGNVFVVFNVGSNDLPLGDISVKVNDNNYHVVRFIRNGANATLQIDDYNVQTLFPQGNRSTLNYKQPPAAAGPPPIRYTNRILLFLC